MKIPLTWLKDFVTLPKSEKELTDKLTMAGHMLDKKIVVGGETVIDLELRGNRADCYSNLGIAREVSALFGNKIKQKPEIKLTPGKINVNLDVKTQLVKRVGMVEIRNVTISPSPKWLSQKLASYGIDSVNNIVDLTNYVMIEMGEPMHAFDLDKIGTDLTIRLAENGERLTTFMGGEITLSNDDLVWAKGDQILSVAGAVGEKYNSISDSTKNVLLEAANYERSNIRRTVHRHKLLTEAGIRHEKELSPEMVESSLGRFLYLLKENNWGEFSPVFYDYYPKRVSPTIINLDLSKLNSLSGIQIDKKEVLGILKRLAFTVISSQKDTLKIGVPNYRTDVLLPEDIIEEILRIYGYDKIPENVLSLPIPKNITPQFVYQEERLRTSSIALGFNEVISNSFVAEKFSNFNKDPQDIGKAVAEVVNAPSPDNKSLRITLLPNLYEQALRALNEREEEVRLFEIGKIYLKDKGGYKERRKIAFIYFDKARGSFVGFKSLISGFIQSANLPPPAFISSPTNVPLTQSYLLTLGKEEVGFGGTVGKDLFFIEFDLDLLLDKEANTNVVLWPKYPPQIEDITFSLPEKVKIGEVMEEVKSISTQVARVELKDVYEGNFTFNIHYQDPKKTLEDSEVEVIRKKIFSTIKSRFGGIVKD